jgi:hypothetical protein
MGYPNPQQIPLPSEVAFRGICVYVPDEPEYVRALLGSLAGLSQWVNWERDENQSASKSANLWKLANDRTLETWSYDCSGGCMSFDCEAMKDCLLEIAEAISVNGNVNVNNVCGVGGAYSTLYCVNEDGDVIVNPPPVTDDPIEPVLPLPPGLDEPPILDLDDPTPPDGFDTWDAYNLAACQAANAIYDWYTRVFDRLIEMLTDDVYQITAVFAIIVNLYTGGWGTVISRAMLLKLAELFARLSIGVDGFTVALILARQNHLENKQEIICSMYQSRDSAASWENMLVTRYFNASSGGLANISDQPLYLDFLRYLLPGLHSLYVIYGNITYSGPTDPLECSQCDVSDLDIFEDFGSISDLSEHWNSSRADIQNGAANLNSTDALQSSLWMTESDLINKWGGVPGLYDNVIISFDWRAVQVDSPTATLRLFAQIEPGITGTIWQSVFGATSDWATVTLGPQALNFTSQAGQELLRWTISGTSSRQIVEIDNIRIIGDSA